MSAIAGWLPRDGRPAVVNDAASLVDSIRFMGPDRQGSWACPEAALAHGAFHTTPESLREVQPLVCGALSLVADARIDNRDELIESLGPSLAALDLAVDGLAPTDADLILAAYHLWGDSCASRLLGDFAFAVWDGNLQRLYAARDPLGVRPFYYYDGPDFFLFASEARALVSAEGVPRMPDERTLLELLYFGFPENTSGSVFKDILTLPSAHQITVSHGVVETERYYELTPVQGLEGLSDEEYAERFRKIFEEAVRCRIRSAFPVGAQLSGGLDSSSVACVTRNIFKQEKRGLLPTFSLVFDATPSSDERPYIQSVLDQGGFEPHFVSGDLLGPLGNLDKIYDLVDDAFIPGTQNHIWSLLQAARKQGVRILLDGIDGDTVVNHGRSRLFELARAGEWKDFGHEVRMLCDNFNDTDHIADYEADFVNTEHVFHIYGRPTLDRLAETGPFTRYARSLYGAARHAGIDARKELRRVWRRLLVPGFLLTRLRPSSAQTSSRWENSSFSKSFVERMKVQDQNLGIPSGAPPPPLTVRPDQLRLLSGPAIPNVLSIGSRVAAASGVELLHPFCDRRLVEFCLSLPSDQSLKNGWPRYILRRAMAAVLPPLVAKRPGKASMTITYARGLFELDASQLQRLTQEPGWASKYLDIEQFRRRVAAGYKLPSLDLGALGATASFLTWMSLLWPSGPLEDSGGSFDADSSNGLKPLAE